MNFLTILPMAFVMIAGPQILSAIFLATSEDWRRNSLAYVAGAALSITLFVSLAYFIGDGLADGGDGGRSDAVSVVILVLLVAAMVHVYLKRGESEPPKWMAKLQSARPRFSFALGFLLLGVFPTDIFTSVAAGASVANDGEPWWHVLPFVGLTLLFLASPSLLLLVFGDRAQALLPKVRDWMNTHSWVVNEIVIGLFVALTISNLA